MARTDDEDAIRFLAPVMGELAEEYRQRGGIGVPRIGLALRTRLLDAPPGVAEWLTRFVDAADDVGISENPEVAQAVQVLGALYATSALPSMFRLAVRIAADSRDAERTPVVFSALWRAFEDLRAHLIEPFLSFIDGGASAIGRLLVLIAEAGVHDERVFHVLLTALARHPGDAATALLVYGDDRALPALRARLATFWSADAATWSRCVSCLVHAIEELGGELDADERCLARAANATERSLAEAATRRARAAEDAAAVALDVDDPNPAVAAVARARRAEEAALDIEQRPTISIAVDRRGERGGGERA